MLDAPRGAFSCEVEVRFRDLDALGHVNNAVYLTYLESARIAYWMALTGNRAI
ncbi:MAG TPA: acyl-CoA thioesterase, partial [Vicinamibacteria bacterium]|nr:acyl-CoA thioesterase [Vicinamibacteria bacterium]